MRRGQRSAQRRWGEDGLDGGTANDLLKAVDENDLLLGEAGHDSLESGFGSDTLYGGAGVDIIGYDAVEDSNDVETDTIPDLARGTDRIGLSEIDAVEGCPGPLRRR
jgi:serralysin